MCIRDSTPVDLTQMSAKVVSSMRASNARVSFESEVPAGLFVEGDSLEIELVLRNLVKNAGESAAQADGVPRVVLAGERIGDEVVITVTDNGPVRTKAEIDAFLVPLRSEKSGGLGLGLAIVRRIIEAYEGHTLEERDGRIVIDGKEATEYTFAMNYYWMMGDNRHNSADSRFWGFVPEDHIVGKASFVWLSLDKEKSFPSNIRWSRMFRKVQ